MSDCFWNIYFETHRHIGHIGFRYFSLKLLLY
jgi:hypothetical protein